MTTQSLSVASVLEANRLSSDTPFLPLLDVEIVDPNTGVVVTVLHFARNTEDVTFQGTVYAAAMFDIQFSTEAGKVSDVTLVMNDYTQAVQGLMEAYGGGVGSNVTFYVVNSGNLGQGPEIAEYYQITSAQAADYVQTFTLGAENVLMQTFPKRRQTKDFCQWRYKSPECGYTGALPSCDLTLQGPNGCRIHGRNLNFGAYPGLNSNGYRYG